MNNYSGIAYTGASDNVEFFLPEKYWKDKTEDEISDALTDLRKSDFLKLSIKDLESNVNKPMPIWLEHEETKEHGRATQRIEYNNNETADLNIDFVIDDIGQEYINKGNVDLSISYAMDFINGWRQPAEFIETSVCEKGLIEGCSILPIKIRNSSKTKPLINFDKNKIKKYNNSFRHIIKLTFTLEKKNTMSEEQKVEEQKTVEQKTVEETKLEDEKMKETNEINEKKRTYSETFSEEDKKKVDIFDGMSPEQKVYMLDIVNNTLKDKKGKLSKHFDEKDHERIGGFISKIPVNDTVIDLIEEKLGNSKMENDELKKEIEELKKQIQQLPVKKQKSIEPIENRFKGIMAHSEKKKTTIDFGSDYSMVNQAMFETVKRIDSGDVLLFSKVSQKLKDNFQNNKK